MKTKTVALAAIAALALPAAAQAAKPAEPGKQGRDKAAQKQAAQKPKGKGFTLTGLIGAENAPAAAPVTGTDKWTLTTETFSLDLISANKHARNVLVDEVFDGTALTSITHNTTDQFLLKAVGFDENEAPNAGDRVKVVGKVTRTRNAKGSETKFTYGTVDIRKVVVTDADDDAAPTA